MGACPVLACFTLKPRLQARVPPALLPDLDLASPPFTAAPPLDDAAAAAAGASSWRATQAPRVWVGPRGAVSPTHWDRSHSFLVQIRGR